MNTANCRQIKKLKIYIFYYCVAIPIIGAILGLLFGCIGCLLLQAVLNHKQLIFLLIFFSLFGFLISIPIVVRQFLITRKIIQSLRNQDDVLPRK